MANSKSLNPADAQDQEVEVLYQKLGGNWFAFSIINDEVFMSPISEDEIMQMKHERAPQAEMNSL